MDICAIPYTLPEHEGLPPEEQIVWTLAIPTPNSWAAAIRSATVQKDGKDEIDASRAFHACLSAHVRGVKGLIRDGNVAPRFPIDDLEKQIAWWSEWVPERFQLQLFRRIDKSRSLDKEEERGTSA